MVNYYTDVHALISVIDKTAEATEGTDMGIPGNAGLLG